MVNLSDFCVSRKLADTLDALFAFGLGDLEMLITKNMIKVFQIESSVCHNDTTSVSVYGDANYKNKRRGRPPKNAKPEQIAIVEDHYGVELSFDDSAYQQAIASYGYYPLLTNKDPKSFSIEDAMLAHKKQYKSEHTYRRAKGPLSIEPIYLHTPEHIEALLFLFKIALQMVVLIERTARKRIQERNRGLDGFCRYILTKLSRFCKQFNALNNLEDTIF